MSYDADTHYLLMANQRALALTRKPITSSSTISSADQDRASKRIIPGLPEIDMETRMDRILKPYRGRTGEPRSLDPEVV